MADNYLFTPATQLVRLRLATTSAAPSVNT
jgi:hypothetical protein